MRLPISSTTGFFWDQCLTAALAYLSNWALCPLQSGVVGNDLKISRLPSACGVLQATPAVGIALIDRVRSLTTQELESQVMICPCAFPENVTPVKSALELTSARIAGPLFWATCPPRRRTCEFPSTRMPALRGSEIVPFCRI